MDPLVEHMEKNWDRHLPAMRRLGHLDPVPSHSGSSAPVDDSEGGRRSPGADPVPRDPNQLQEPSSTEKRSRSSVGRP
jgi:hypothetical protein